MINHQVNTKILKLVKPPPSSVSVLIQHAPDKANDTEPELCAYCTCPVVPGVRRPIAHDRVWCSVLCWLADSELAGAHIRA